MARIGPTGPNGWDGGRNWPNASWTRSTKRDNPSTSSSSTVPAAATTSARGAWRCSRPRLNWRRRGPVWVFVDDYDRLVERVWANTMLRPNFDHEVLVQDTVLEHLKYFTHDKRMECILPKAAAPPASVEDYKGLENHFRPGGEEAKQLGFPTAGAFENATPEQAKAGCARSPT